MRGEPFQWKMKMARHLANGWRCARPAREEEKQPQSLEGMGFICTSNQTAQQQEQALKSPYICRYRLLVFFELVHTISPSLNIIGCVLSPREKEVIYDAPVRLSVFSAISSVALLYSTSLPARDELCGEELLFEPCS